MRAVWTGAIRFGLILIPVRLFRASREKNLEFVQLDRKDRSRIRNVRINETTHKEVPYEEVVHGYEYESGRFVTLEKQDFQQANVQKTQTIDIIHFVNEDDVDPRFFVKPFYTEPNEAGMKAYALLREAMRQSGKVAIARFVMRTREYLAMLKSHGDAILLEEMRFASEVRGPEGLTLPEKKIVAERETRMGVKLIDLLAEPWKPERYRDTYTEDLQRLIHDKIEGKEHVLQNPEIISDIQDLFTALNESLTAARDMQKNKRQV